MVYGIKIKDGVDCHTCLKTYFDALNGKQKEYNWLISYFECYPLSENFQSLLSGEYYFVSGDELTQMIEIEDFQWVWGIFSAFDKSVSKQEILECRSNFDYEDDAYTGYSHLPLEFRHPLSKIEIIADDSSSTTILAADENIVRLIEKTFPLAVNLVEGKTLFASAEKLYSMSIQLKKYNKKNLRFRHNRVELLRMLFEMQSLVYLMWRWVKSEDEGVFSNIHHELIIFMSELLADCISSLIQKEKGYRTKLHTYLWQFHNLPRAFLPSTNRFYLEVSEAIKYTKRFY